MTVHFKDRILSVTACRTFAAVDPAEDEKTIDLRLDTLVAATRRHASRPLEVGRG